MTTTTEIASVQMQLTTARNVAASLAEEFSRAREA